MRRLLLALPLLLAPTQDAPGFARATLNVQQGATRGADGIWRGGAYALVDRFEIPAGHGPRDTLIAFEGPGWESDRVAYRLYLDERNVPDIFGKKLPAPILGRIGMGGDDYHANAEWGMDILQVNQTLGAGGIGVLRDGHVTQLGAAEGMRAIVRNSAARAEVRVETRGFAGAGGRADLAATYAIAPGSRLTFVDARADGAVPVMVAGFIRHAGTSLITGESGGWRYAATWGIQSLAQDGLGLALFWRAADAGAAAEADGNVFIRFADPRRIRYAFAGVWVQEPGAPQDEAGFRAWLEATVAGLDD